VAVFAVALGASVSCSSEKNVTITLPKSVIEYQTVDLAKGHQLATDAYQISNSTKAIKAYKKALQTYQEQPAAWNNMGVLLMDEDQFVQAAEAFKQAAQLSPSDPRPLYNLGIVWDKRGYVREARRFYSNALDRDASYLPALRAGIRADSILQEGSDETLEWLERALMLERDTKWQHWMKLQRVRIEQQLSGKSDP